MTISPRPSDPGSPVRPRIAVIGGGVAGIVAAWKLREQAEVSLFEDLARLGGHTHTVEIPDGPDAGTWVDTGFIVLNDRNYPNLHDFLRELDVPARWSDMSFGYHDEVSGLQYSGRGLRGLLADPWNALRADMWRIVADFLRFNREGIDKLELGDPAGSTLGRFLSDRGFSRAFVEHYLVPMGAAIWSTSNEGMLEFPLEVFLEFFRNHGLLSVGDRPHWQTVVGGSHSYVKRFQERFTGRLVTSAQVTGVDRDRDGVVVHRGNAPPERFDGVVFAVHADQVLPLLRDADESERRLFGSWSYQENHVVLHSDESVLPSREMARASWNFTRERDAGRQNPVSITYDMNRLQGLATKNRWLVTLNRASRIEPSKVVRELVYHHPSFTLDAIASRERIQARNGIRRTWFTGSYFGFGFHEDAVKASVDLVRNHFPVRS